MKGAALPLDARELAGFGETRGFRESKAEGLPGETLPARLVRRWFAGLRMIWIDQASV
jgi:hypothetical protein